MIEQAWELMKIISDKCLWQYLQTRLHLIIYTLGKNSFCKIAGVCEWKDVLLCKNLASWKHD